MAIQKRGILTERIKAKSKELLGYEISQDELRVMPYLQFVLVNDKRLRPTKISAIEIAILAKWVKAGYILRGVSKTGRPSMYPIFTVSKLFWDAMLEIIYLGYVDLTDESS